MDKCRIHSINCEEDCKYNERGICMLEAMRSVSDFMAHMTHTATPILDCSHTYGLIMYDDGYTELAGTPIDPDDYEYADYILVNNFCPGCGKKLV